MKFKEITLSTHFLNELKTFYRNILELKVHSEIENSFRIETCSTNIIFNKILNKDKPFYHFAFNIPENQFKAAKQWALSRVKLIKLNGVDEFDFKSWNAHSIYFYDPAGNIIELIARHNLNNKSKEIFSGKSFLNISEIGLPVFDVKEFYNILKKNFNISLFSGDLKTFTAMGNDEGLFIIVPKGRKWFPDCQEAEIFPITVKMISNSVKEIEFINLPYKIMEIKQ